MAKTVAINGQDVHPGFIVMNTIWIVVTLGFLPFLAIQLYRLYTIFQKSKNASAFHGLCVQWTHITLVYLCHFITAADASHAYFDEALHIKAILLGA